MSFNISRAWELGGSDSKPDGYDFDKDAPMFIYVTQCACRGGGTIQYHDMEHAVFVPHGMTCEDQLALIDWAKP